MWRMLCCWNHNIPKSTKLSEHQQPWHWLWMINEAFSSTRKDWNSLCLRRLETANIFTCFSMKRARYFSAVTMLFNSSLLGQNDNKVRDSSFKCNFVNNDWLVSIILWSPGVWLLMTQFNDTYTISQEICTRFLLCCALLWLYIDWFSHIHQAYFTGTVAL